MKAGDSVCVVGLAYAGNIFYESFEKGEKRIALTRRG